jgi:hypothetical protein
MEYWIKKKGEPLKSPCRLAIWFAVLPRDGNHRLIASARSV